MKKRNLIIHSILFSTLILSCNNNSDTKEEARMNRDTNLIALDTSSVATAQVNTTPLEKEDSFFLLQAANGGLVEAEFANFAQHRARHQRIKDFAIMVLRDHSQSNQELENFAASRNIVLPDTIGSKHEGHLQKLLTTGNNFDKTYLELMVQMHKDDVKNFEKAAVEVKDLQLKTWVEKVLPVLKVHRDSAVAINMVKL